MFKPKKEKTIAVSGYFLWLHAGHLQYIKEASKNGKVVVIVNNDLQQVLKYNKVVVSLEERVAIMNSLKYVDRVVASIDEDRTVCKTLEKLNPDMFGNGGDRTSENIPENAICDKLGIQLIFGLGTKINSSSDLLKNDPATIQKIKEEIPYDKNTV